MKHFTFDLDALASEKQKLETRLRAIEAILAMADLAQEVPEPPPVVRLESPPVAVSELPPKSHRNHQDVQVGIRRQIGLALHTERATEQELARSLGIKAKDIRSSIRTMRMERLVYLGETGHFSNTPEGTKRALWFLRNQDMVFYQPSPLHPEAPNTPALLPLQKTTNA